MLSTVNRCVAACGAQVSVWGIPTLDLLTSLEPGGGVQSLAFSPRAW